MTTKQALYYRAGYRTVPGWSRPLDFRAMAAVYPGGNVAEIGVHHGRTLVWLAMLAQNSQPGSWAAGVDLFSDQHLNTSKSGNGNHLAVVRHCRRWLGKVPLLIRGDSRTVTVRYLAMGAWGLVHVDGGHDYPTALCDLATAGAMLRPGGVLCIDDWGYPMTPGVSQAINEATALGYFKPFAVVGNKLYATTNSDSPHEYLARLRLAMWPRTEVRHEFHGNVLACYAYESAPRVLAKRLVAAAGARG